MSYTVIGAFGNATVTLAANESIAVKTLGVATVYQVVGYPNYPSQNDLLGTVTNTETVFGPYTSGATIYIEANGYGAFYAQGTAPLVGNDGKWQKQGDPTALNATGALTAAAMLGGIVTSTTAAAVTATIPTGPVLDAANDFAIGDSFDFSVINTGGSNAFTLSAASGHTIVGAAAVAASSSGTFRTRKTAADTFVTYRLD